MHEIYEPHRFYQNKGCKYFPCHDLVESDLSKALFNCMFCYCPLYALGKDCGGNFKIIKFKDGKLIKDCSDCVLPHRPEMYEYITQKLGELKLNLEDDESSKEKFVNLSDFLPGLQEPSDSKVVDSGSPLLGKIRFEKLNLESFEIADGKEVKETIGAIKEMIDRLNGLYAKLKKSKTKKSKKLSDNQQLQLSAQIHESFTGLDRLLLRLISQLEEPQNIIALPQLRMYVEDLESEFNRFLSTAKFAETDDYKPIVDGNELGVGTHVADFKIHKDIVPEIINAILLIATGDVLDMYGEPSLHATMGDDKLKSTKVNLVTFAILQDLSDALEIFFSDDGDDDIPVKKVFLRAVQHQLIDDLFDLIEFLDIDSVSPGSQKFSSYVHPQLLKSASNVVKFFTDFCDNLAIPEYCEIKNLESFKFFVCDVCGQWEIFFKPEEIEFSTRVFHNIAMLASEIALDSMEFASFAVASPLDSVTSEELDEKISQVQRLIQAIEDFPGQKQVAFEHSDEPVDPLALFQVHSSFARIAKAVNIINLAPNSKTSFGRRLFDLLKFKLNEFLISQDFVEFVEFLELDDDFKLSDVPEPITPVVDDVAELSNVLLQCYTVAKEMGEVETYGLTDAFSAKHKEFDELREKFRDYAIRVLLSTAIQEVPDSFALMLHRRKFISFSMLTEAAQDNSSAPQSAALMNELIDSFEFTKVTEMLFHPASD